MRRRSEFDNTKMSFTLTKAGCRESAPVEITGEELAELNAQLRSRKPKAGPQTKGQAEAAALFSEFVRRGMGLE